LVSPTSNLELNADSPATLTARASRLSVTANGASDAPSMAIASIVAGSSVVAQIGNPSIRRWFGNRIDDAPAYGCFSPG
jgi:hypothetical protein